MAEPRSLPVFRIHLYACELAENYLAMAAKRELNTEELVSVFMAALDMDRAASRMLMALQVMKNAGQLEGYEACLKLVEALSPFKS